MLALLFQGVKGDHPQCDRFVPCVHYIYNAQSLYLPP